MVKEFVKGKQYRTPNGEVVKFAFINKDGEPMFESHKYFIESMTHEGYFGLRIDVAKKYLTELPDEAV
jgi:hypothetical protein